MFPEKFTKQVKRYASIIKQSMNNPRNYMTLPEACLKTGLNIKEAEQGVMYLIGEYRGHISVTEKGHLMFRFPYGMQKPWLNKKYFFKFYSKIKDKAIGITKIILRSWISIVMISYLATFIIVLVLIAFAKRDAKGDRGIFGDSLILHFLIRLIFDSLFWTFHPFSPFSYKHSTKPIVANKKSSTVDIKFYEKINQFIFGVEKPIDDILSINKKILHHIYSNNGYTSLYEIMKIIPMSKEDIQSLLAKFVINYNGKIIINDNGSVTYYFEDIIKNNNTLISKHEKTLPIWHLKKKIPSLTGNSWKMNFLITAMNGFNLIMSFFIIKNDLTITKIKYIISATNASNFDSLFIDNIYNNTPLLLGWIPFSFSAVIFIIPIIRILFRNKNIKMIKNENGYKGLIKGVSRYIENNKAYISEQKLIDEWYLFSGYTPSVKEISTAISKIGGKMQIDNNGQVLYHFNEFFNEHTALKTKQLSTTQITYDKIIFSSEE